MSFRFLHMFLWKNIYIYVNDDKNKNIHIKIVGVSSMDGRAFVRKRVKIIHSQPEV